jgi:hypothetical protein
MWRIISKPTDNPWPFIYLDVVMGDFGGLKTSF